LALKLLVVWHKLPPAFTFPHLHGVLSQPGWAFCKPATFAYAVLCSETHFPKFGSCFKPGLLSERMVGPGVGMGGYAGACLLLGPASLLFTDFSAQ